MCLTSQQEAFLSCSQGPKDSDLHVNHPVPPLSLPSLPYLQLQVLPQSPYSVLRSSAISSMGCQRLRTWYRGLPLVHPQLCGSVASHSQMPTQGTWKASGSPPMSACPKHRNSVRTLAISLPALPLHLWPHNRTAGKEHANQLCQAGTEYLCPHEGVAYGFRGHGHLALLLWASGSTVYVPQ